MDTEVTAYLTELRTLKQDLLAAVAGLGDDAVNWRPLPGDTNSIFALLSHLAGSENNWVRRVIAGESIVRDRAAEFLSSGHVSDVINAWSQSGLECESILAGLESSQLGDSRKLPAPQGETSVSVRWCILHLISHYATHLGHIQLTRQLWDQRTTQPAES